MTKRTVLGVCAVAAVMIAMGPFGAAEDMTNMTKELWGSAPRTTGTGPAVVTLADSVIITEGPRAIGTIQYDTGVMTGAPGAPFTDFMVGNQFDTFNTGSPVTANGSVATIQAYMATLGGGTAAYLSLYGPVTGGGSAPKLLTTNLPMSVGMNTLTGFGPVNYTGSSFLAGVWMASTTADIVALDSNLGPMGAHGCAIDDNYPNPTGLSFTLIPGNNAIVRATGNIVPVELQKFDIR